jgi:hypothetical protein
MRCVPTSRPPRAGAAPRALPPAALRRAGDRGAAAAGAAGEHRRRDAEVHRRRRHEGRSGRVSRAHHRRQGRARRRLRRPGRARRGRRVRAGLARVRTDLRGDPDQRCDARDSGAGQSQRTAHGGGRHRRSESPPAAVRLDGGGHREGRSAGDLRTRRRLPGRLPGRHRHRRAARPGRLAGGNGRAALGRARPVAATAVHLERRDWRPKTEPAAKPDRPQSRSRRQNDARQPACRAPRWRSPHCWR